jgi:hypothetical protein
MYSSDIFFKCMILIHYIYNLHISICHTYNDYIQECDDYIKQLIISYIHPTRNRKREYQRNEEPVYLHLCSFFYFLYFLYFLYFFLSKQEPHVLVTVEQGRLWRTAQEGCTVHSTLLMDSTTALSIWITSAGFSNPILRTT